MEKRKYKDIEYELDNGLSVGYCKSLELLHSDLKWYHEELGCYQGSFYSLGISRDKIFYLKVNSYGSCSVCDWIQGINTVEEAENFFKHQEKLQCLGKDKNKVIEYLRKEMENNYDFDENHFNNLKNYIEGL